MVCAYRAGGTARELAAAHDISLSSVKRFLREPLVGRPVMVGVVAGIDLLRHGGISRMRALEDELRTYLSGRISTLSRP